LIANIFIYGYFSDKQMMEVMKKKDISEKMFKKVKSSAFDDDDSGSLPIDEVMDFGRINDALGKGGIDIFDVYKKLKLSAASGAVIKSFIYGISGYNPKNPATIPPPKFNINGAINTPSGDVEDLFKQYDGLLLATKNAFPNYNVTYSELPKDIDFSKKYYNFSYDLTITGR